ncbi:flagellar hook-associated protein FlgK [Clostridium sp. BL-8]|uniref:flagellar hook-associated protein FlgK n=1 Tax=Clostridium sp. BL-8 TaxID=349938 RepID=UPI00098C6600|nr:flagellar hook-associated protein FlgK [Clostridium sp. BL-8]OOM79986.1 flagellar hook-associated protein 1 [Clostridium sp. BL-8]
MGGLFDTFSIGKRGLSAQQTNIDVTSHNISNSETVGYTRQRANATTTTPSGGNSKFDSISVGQIGTGVEITSIQRIRDTFIDKQVRDTQTESSYYDIQDSYLSAVSKELDETSSDEGLKKDLSDFYNDLQELSTATGNTDSNKTVAISAAETLANDISTRYKELDTEESNLQQQLQTNVTSINGLLDEINDYNKQIEKITAQGLTANDLMDRRDNDIDTLSKQFGITVKEGDNDGLDITSSDDPSIKLVDSADTTGTSSARFSYVDSVTDPTDDGSGNGTYSLTITYDKLGDSGNKDTITLTGLSDADAEKLKSSFETNRILTADKDGVVSIGSVTGGDVTANLTDGATTTSITTDLATIEKSIFTPSKGDVGGNIETQNKIEGYKSELDAFAITFAYTVNAIQTGSTDGTANSSLPNNVPIFINSDKSTSSSVTDDGISAKNIAINSNLNASNLNCNTSNSSGNDGARALAMANIASLKIDYSSVNTTNSSTRADFFSSASGTGLAWADDKDCALKSSASNGTTLSNYYSNLVSGIDSDANEASSSSTNWESNLNIYEDNRTSVSGVSLDEEMSNLIEFQHAYQASAKIISTVSDLLDTVIGLVK